MMERRFLHFCISVGASAASVVGFSHHGARPATPPIRNRRSHPCAGRGMIRGRRAGGVNQAQQLVAVATRHHQHQIDNPSGRGPT